MVVKTTNRIKLNINCNTKYVYKPKSSEFLIVAKLEYDYYKNYHNILDKKKKNHKYSINISRYVCNFSYIYKLIQNCMQLNYELW